MHWSAPLHVADLYLTDRIPNAQDRKAVTWPRRAVIEWLEAVTIDADGFISWGGLLDTCPVAPDLMVEVLFRGETSPSLASAPWSVNWKHAGIVAYRVVADDAPVPGPARRKGEQYLYGGSVAA